MHAATTVTKHPHGPFAFGAGPFVAVDFFLLLKNTALFCLDGPVTHGGAIYRYPSSLLYVNSQLYSTAVRSARQARVFSHIIIDDL